MIENSSLNTFSKERTALIIVDMQNDFCSAEGKFAKSGRDVSSINPIINNLSLLLERARNTNVTVIFLQQITLPNKRSDSDIWYNFKIRDGKSPEYTLLGSEGAEIIEELAPLKNEIVIQKFRPSGFHGTFLDQILRANGIDSVLITGTTTEGCVMATVLDASFHDYNTGVITDGIASSVPKMQEAALTFMATRYKLFSTKQVLELW